MEETRKGKWKEAGRMTRTWAPHSKSSHSFIHSFIHHLFNKWKPPRYQPRCGRYIYKSYLAFNKISLVAKSDPKNVEWYLRNKSNDQIAMEAHRKNTEVSLSESGKGFQSTCGLSWDSQHNWSLIMGRTFQSSSMSSQGIVLTLAGGSAGWGPGYCGRVPADLRK